MKKLLAVVMAVACATAFATDYTWTGGGTAGSWKDPANWGGSGYPHEAGDKAMIDTGTDDLSIALDTGISTELQSLTLTGTGKLTLSATEGSSFTNTVAYGGVTVPKGATLDLRADFVSSQRLDLAGPGTFHIRSRVGTVINNVALYLPVGYYYLEDDANVFSSGIIGVGYSSSFPNEHCRIEIKDRARFSTAKRIEIGSHASSPNCEIVQDGDDTYVENLGYLSIGTCPRQSYDRKMSYTLKRGTHYTKGDMRVAECRPGWFTQEGGTFDLGGSIFLGNTDGAAASTNCLGACRLAGGTFNLGSYIHDNSPNVEFELAGGTLHLTDYAGSGRYVVSVDRASISGSSRIEFGRAKYLTFTQSPSFATNSVLTVDMPERLSFDTDLIVRGGSELVLTNGTFNLPSGKFVRLADGDTEPWKLTLEDGGFFQYADTGSYITAPVVLTTRGTGAVDCQGSRIGFFFRKATVDGTELNPTGLQWIYNNDATYGTTDKGFICSANKNSCYMKPYVWTGAGDGRTWSDKDNWAGGIFPNHYQYSADLTMAKNDIVLDRDINVRAIVFGSGGPLKRLAIVDNGEGHALTINQNGYVSSVLVDKEKTIVFDVRAVWNSSNSALSGRGDVVFKRNICAGCDGSSNSPSFCYEANAIYEGATEMSTGNWVPAGSKPTLSFWAFCANEKCEVVFGEGTDLAITNLVLSRSGYTNYGNIRQRGAKMWFDEMYINHHHANKIAPLEYWLQSGELTVGTGLYLCRNYPNGETSWSRYEDGDFRMTGGTLTTPLMTSECNSNYFYLYGGDVYLGAGGVQRTDDTTRRSRFVANTSPCLKFGGVRFHATDDIAIGIDAEFNGTGGTALIDTVDHAIVFNEKVEGSSGFAKVGSGALTFNGECAIAGAVVVKEGSLALGAKATVTASPKSLSLSSAEALSLAGQTLEVEDLFIGGVRQAAGSYDFGTGKVVTSASGATGCWIGSDGGSWMSVGNWSGDVPNGATATVDFRQSAASGDYRIVLGGAVQVKELAGISDGTLTLAASGSEALTLAADGTVTVAKGTKLVIDAAVAVGAGVQVCGGGELVFKRMVTGAGSLTAAEGANVTFEGSIENIQLAELTFGDDPTTSTMVLKGAGCTVTLDDLPSRTTGSVRGVTVVDGATVSFAGTPNFALAAADAEEVLTLTSGKLLFNQTVKCATAGNGVFNLNGGVLNCTTVGTLLPAALHVVLGGDVAFAQQNHTAQTDDRMKTTVAAQLSGEGTIEQKGPGWLKITTDAQKAVTGWTVSGGILEIAGLTAATNFTVSGGKMILREVATEKIPETAVVTCAAESATLELDYDGTVTVRALYRNGKQLRKGVYGEGVAPARRQAPIVGRGFLNVLEGDPSGMQILVR